MKLTGSGFAVRRGRPGGEDSHVIAAMVHKYVKAAERAEAVLWGSGEPSREFLYLDDAARALILAAEHAGDSEPFNVGTGVAGTWPSWEGFVIENAIALAGRWAEASFYRTGGAEIDLVLTWCDGGE